MLPTYLLSRFARGEVKVALSGDGADELFGGYERYLAMRYLGKFDFLPEAVRRPLFRMAAAMIPNIGIGLLLEADRKTFERTFDLFRRQLRPFGAGVTRPLELRFVFFDGEEARILYTDGDGFHGSQRYVSELRRRNELR